MPKEKKKKGRALKEVSGGASGFEDKKEHNFDKWDKLMFKEEKK